MIATVAPKEAPCDTPSVDAEASGLRSTLCMTQPVSARATPATIEVTMRGRRTFHTMALVLQVPLPTRVYNTSLIVSPDDPDAIEISETATIIKSSKSRKRRFFIM